MSSSPQQQARSQAGPVERAVELALLGCGLAPLLTSVGILVVLLLGSASLFADVSLADFLASGEWAPLGAAPQFGVWPLVTGTLLTSAIAIAVALPVGLLAAIHLAEFSSPSARRLLEPTLEVVAGVPTIVFGFIALVYVTPLLQRVVPGLAAHNGLSAGVVIGIMIAPMIASLSAEALLGVPRSLREAAWSLGAGEIRTIVRIVLPAASSGIAAAVVLAVSRAIGETMIVSLAAGSRPALTLDPRVPIETMTTHIVALARTDVGAQTPAFRSVFAVGAALLVFTFLTNLVARRLLRRSREVSA